MSDIGPNQALYSTVLDACERLGLPRQEQVLALCAAKTLDGRACLAVDLIDTTTLLAEDSAAHRAHALNAADLLRALGCLQHFGLQGDELVFLSIKIEGYHWLLVELPSLDPRVVNGQLILSEEYYPP